MTMVDLDGALDREPFHIAVYPTKRGLWRTFKVYPTRGHRMVLAAQCTSLEAANAAGRMLLL